MSALAWWLIPIGATLLALLWAAWRSRPARQPDAHEAMNERERFRAAMERPLPDRGRWRRPVGSAAPTGQPAGSDAGNPAA